MSEHITTAIQAFGGLGMFLLGMIIMTEGLREVAGDAIRSALMRFSATPASGALTGAISTAILQSSSATTVAAVGFVGAGLMTFTSSLGIIFGANIGTTITGWMVALLGFKLKLGTVMLPVILLGALLRLFAKGKVRSAGYALAGFGLIFVAIGVMQTGMAGLQGIVTPETLPPDTVVGRIQTVMIGALATVITQSSSAGVAATMTALHAGAISFEQGLALIIGMDVGTTITAVIATIGGTTAARRTGVSHMIYNMLTAMGALLLINPYIGFWHQLFPGALHANAEIGLVAFHTLFNTLGVILVLPVTSQFASMMKKLIPEQKLVYSTAYDDRLLQTPAFALSAVQEHLLSYYTVMLNHLESLLSFDKTERRADLARMRTALDETREYLDQVDPSSASDNSWERMLALVHALDHLKRLRERCDEEQGRAATARDAEVLSPISGALLEVIDSLLQDMVTGNWDEIVVRSREVGGYINESVEPMRDTIASSVVDGKIDVPEATDCLEALRWIERVSHHVARIALHLQQARLASGK